MLPRYETFHMEASSQTPLEEIYGWSFNGCHSGLNTDTTTTLQETGGKEKVNILIQIMFEDKIDVFFDCVISE